DRVLRQLGWVEDSLVAGRFFREELAADPGKLGVSRASPVLLLQGAASTAPALGRGEDSSTTATHRVPRTTVLAATDTFWPGAGQRSRAAARPPGTPRPGGPGQRPARGGGKRGGRAARSAAPAADPQRLGPGPARPGEPDPRPLRPARPQSRRPADARRVAAA